MLTGLALPRFNLHKYTIRYLMMYTLCIWLSYYLITIGIQTLESVKLNHTEVPLILNSNVVKTEKAEVIVTLWMENCEMPDNILNNKPLPGWKWTLKKLSNASGLEAITISGHKVIDKNEERNLYTWYTDMAQKLSQRGCQIYLDERVPQAIDVCSYLSEKKARPAQWSLSNDLISVAAYVKDVPTSVMAGQDQINMQLLSRGKSAEGQTVLAIPALLEEF